MISVKRRVAICSWVPSSSGSYSLIFIYIYSHSRDGGVPLLLVATSALLAF